MSSRALALVLGVLAALEINCGSAETATGGSGATGNGVSSAGHGGGATTAAGNGSTTTAASGGGTTSVTTGSATTSAGGTTTASSGTTGAGATTGAGSTTGAGATTGAGSTTATSSAGGTTTSSASASSSSGGAAGCAPAVGIAYSYACWPMPNPASSGLPNPSSYTDLGDGTVKDNVTGLVWQKAVTSTQAFDWPTAQTYCTSLTLAGRAWRLPTRIELLSLVDFTRTGPAIDTTAFPGVPGGKYHWTASPWVVSQIATKPQYSWIVNFSEGLTSNAGDRTQAEYARCVSSSRPGPLPKLYTQVATGEVEDVETGLVWQQGDSTTMMDFASAAPYCAGLGLNGHTWRVPSIKELSTLVDETPPITKVSPAIDTTTFPSTPANAPYWSSTLFNKMAATAHDPWVINFEDGFTEYTQTAGLVRCVR